MPVFECARCNEMTYSAYNRAGTECARCGSSRMRVIDGAFDAARLGERELGAGDHSTIVFDDPADVAGICARYLEEGIVRDERVIANVSPGLREPLEAELRSAAAAEVDWQDPSEMYADFDADRLAGEYDEMIASEARTTRLLAGVHMECLEGVEPADFDRYERLAHEIVIRRGAVALCAYDAASLSPELLEVGARRHTLAVVGGVARRNEHFVFEQV